MQEAVFVAQLGIYVAKVPLHLFLTAGTNVLGTITRNPALRPLTTLTP